MNSIFILLAVLVVMLNACFVWGPYVPIYDTSLAFDSFYFFYNHFYFYGNLPQWMPHYNYGIPSHYWQLFALTPSSYFFILLGYLFKVHDVLLMFKLSIVMEQLVFLTGMYLLSQRLFVARSTVFMVCLGAMASSFWYDQLYFSFRIFYMFPWMLLGLVCFFQDKKPEYFWLTGIAVWISAMGNNLYCVFLWIPFLLFFAVLSAIPNGGFKAFKALLQKSVKNILSFAAFLVLSFCFFYQLKAFAQQVDVLQRGKGYGNSLGVFLTYGDLFGTLKGYFESFILGQNAEAYIGVLPAAMAVWGLLVLRKNPRYRAFAWLWVTMAWFSCAGVLAGALYFFPGMVLYRHVGFTYGLVKVLMALCAGFALDHFWGMDRKAKILSLLSIAVAVIFLADGFGISWQWLSAMSVVKPSVKSLLFEPPLDTQFFRAGIYWGALVFMALVRRKDIVKPLLLVVFCLDIFSFQFAVYDSRLKEWETTGNSAYALFVNREDYQPRRTENPVHLRSSHAIGMLGWIKYATVYNLAQFDPCHALHRLDFAPKDLSRLMAFGEKPKDLDYMMGCSAPKLRLTSSLDQKKNLESRITVKDFSADHLTLQADAPAKGAWLVYADAYHPGWHALVNGRPQPVKKAHLVFKAVFIQGPSEVKFYFNAGLSTFFSGLFMVIGLVISLVWAWAFLNICRRPLIAP